MLFLGNVKAVDIDYEELQDLSLRFLPYAVTVNYPLSLSENYVISSSSKGYYDPKFIYNYTGYWNDDLYRLGIVYILGDNTLTPVFNIRGRENVGVYDSTKTQYTNIPVYENGVRKYISYNSDTNILFTDTTLENTLYENVKGVVSISSDLDTNIIYGFNIRTDEDTLSELKKHNIKGFFFVRQRRMPLTLCQGLTMPIENNSDLIAIPTLGGVANVDFENTYIEADRSQEGIKCILEGFMHRYIYNLKPKSSGFWSTLGKGLLAAVVVGAAVATCIVTAGVGAVAIGATATLTSAGLTTALTTAAIVAGAIAATTGVVATAQEVANVVAQTRNRTEAKNPYRGRNEAIPSGYKRVETDDSRKLDGTYSDRIILVDYDKCRIGAMLVPDYFVNQPYYNQLFTSDEFTVKYRISQPLTWWANEAYFTNNNGRHYYFVGYEDKSGLSEKYETVKLASIYDGLAYGGIDTYGFRAKAGDESMAYKFKQVLNEYKDNTLNTDSDLVRGVFGPYVAMTGFQGPACTLVDIKIPGYTTSNLQHYMEIRMNDHSEYSAISDRFCLDDLYTYDNLGQLTKTITSWNVFRGDCYICQFT